MMKELHLLRDTVWYNAEATLRQAAKLFFKETYVGCRKVLAMSGGKRYSIALEKYRPKAGRRSDNPAYLEDTANIAFYSK